MKNNTHTSQPTVRQGSLLKKIIRSKIFLIIIAIIIVAGGAVVFFFLKNNSFEEQYGLGCQDRQVAFTSPPMKMEELAYIRPLGAVNDGHVTPTDHVYVGGPNPNAADNSYAVLMPADGTVTDVSAMPAQYIGDRAGQTLAPEDHRIVVSHSCRYYSIFIHIHALSDPLKQAVGTLQPNESKRANVELKAGDVIGFIGGSTFDWTPVDTSVTLPGFITPSLYEGEPWKIHTVSPFDLYTGTLKAQLEAKSLRTTPPVGGKIDYDQRGKLIGNWFKEGTAGYTATTTNGGRYWDGHLAVVPDYIDPTSTVVSIGNWNGTSQQFAVQGRVDPSLVSEQDGVVAYELGRGGYMDGNNQPWNGSSHATGLRVIQEGPIEGTILFQVLPGEKVKVETFPGKSKSQVTGFTENAQLYTR